MLKKAETGRWHKEPYVWLLILFPVIAVAGGLFTIWLAWKTSDGLVVDDYYIRGLAINQDLERDQAAGTYALHVSLDTGNPEGMLTVNLSGNEKFEFPDIINIAFIHATRSGFDRSFVIRKNADNLYKTTMPELVRGKWHVLITAGDWRKMATYTIE